LRENCPLMKKIAVPPPGFRFMFQAGARVNSYRRGIGQEKRKKDLGQIRVALLNIVQKIIKAN